MSRWCAARPNGPTLLRRCRYASWDLPHLSGLLPLGIPIEDLAWYLYTAALWGAYYKFATGQRVVAYASMRSSSRSSSRSTRRSTSSLI